MTLVEKLRSDPLDGFRWDDENATPRAEHRHADDPPARIERNAAFRLEIEPVIQMDPAVDLAAAQAPPGAAYKGDDAERRAQALRLPPCGKDGMTRAKPTCRMKGDLLQRLLRRRPLRKPSLLS